ncbi:MAG: zf-HC2 domain-containing protein [Gemmatimonadota bacterium]|nr:MAG: zf-HC2 domain-containing protein [Gemmatimonadota bacterium]
MGDDWEQRLSEYLDGDLAGVERRDMEAHLADCNECRVTLDELRAVAARAAALENRAPERDLWRGIARRIGARGSTQPGIVDVRERRVTRRWRITVSLPQLVAAGVVLVMLSVGTTWLLRPSGSQPAIGSPATFVQAAAAQATRAGFDIDEYDAVVADLELVLDQARERLDPNTVRVLEQSLATIDRAIMEAYEALEQDPTNSYLNSHLAVTMKRKVELLRQAATIASSAS